MFSICSSFSQIPVPVFASLFTKIKAYSIIADHLKGHVTTNSTWILRRKGGLPLCCVITLSSVIYGLKELITSSIRWYA